MRIRPVLAIALLATGLGAPVLAAQLPARELAFGGYPDPYVALEPGDGGMQSVATRFISRAGWIYVLGTYHLELFEASPENPLGLAGYFVGPPSLTVVTDYEVSDYPCLSSYNCHQAKAINQTGRIVGGEYYFFPGYETTRPYWVDPQPGPNPGGYLTKPAGYPTPGSDDVHAMATAINGDLIAGWATRGIPSVGLAPIWWSSPSALAQELPRIPGLDAGPFPTRINTAGVIVGNTAGSAPIRAAVWRPTYTGYVLALLGELPGGTKSRVYDIGFFGGIVGRSDDGSGTPVAVVWKWSGPGYSVTPLPVPPGGSCSAATAINTNGDVAGNCTLGDGAERGVVWRKVGGTYELLHELEPLPGYTRSVAYALDDDGQAGGGSGPLNAERAVLWPVVSDAPVQVPALSHVSLLCLAAVIAGATAATLPAR